MNTLKSIYAFIIGSAITITAGLYLSQTKSDILGPLAGKCPQAIDGFLSTLTTLGVSSQTTIALIDCGVGVAVYLLIPGFGIGWLIVKYLL